MLRKVDKFQLWESLPITRVRSPEIINIPSLWGYGVNRSIRITMYWTKEEVDEELNDKNYDSIVNLWYHNEHK